MACKGCKRQQLVRSLHRSKASLLEQMIKRLQFQGLQLDVVDKQTKLAKSQQQSRVLSNKTPATPSSTGFFSCILLKMNIWPSGFCKVNLRMTLLSARLLLVCIALPSSDTAAHHRPPLSHPVGIFALFLKHFHAPSALPQPPLHREQQTVKTDEWQSVEACLCVRFIRHLWHEATEDQLPQQKEREKKHLNHIYFMHIFHWFILLKEQNDILFCRKCAELLTCL